MRNVHPSTDTVLHITHATAKPGKWKLVRDVSFKLERGERLSLFGPAASGKTTLLKMISGSVPLESGRIHIRGKQPRAMSKAIGYTNDKRLPSLFSPHQILSQALILHNLPSSQRAARLVEALNVTDLYEQRDCPVRELSSCQLVALRVALAIVHKPLLVLLDNDLAPLPRRTRENINRHLLQMQTTLGAAVVHSTTSSVEAEMADFVLLLDEGRTLAHGTPEQLMKAHGKDTVIVEALYPEDVRKTLRGIFDVEVMETEKGIRFRAMDGQSHAAKLLRAPAGGVRTIYLKKPDLWDVWEDIRTRTDENEMQPAKELSR